MALWITEVEEIYPESIALSYKFVGAEYARRTAREATKKYSQVRKESAEKLNGQNMIPNNPYYDRKIKHAKVRAYFRRRSDTRSLATMHWTKFSTDQAASMAQESWREAEILFDRWTSVFRFCVPLDVQSVTIFGKTSLENV